MESDFLNSKISLKIRVLAGKSDFLDERVAN